MSALACTAHTLHLPPGDFSLCHSTSENTISASQDSCKRQGWVGLAINAARLPAPQRASPFRTGLPKRQGGRKLAGSRPRPHAHASPSPVPKPGHHVQPRYGAAARLHLHPALGHASAAAPGRERGAPGAEGKAEGNAIGGRSSSGIKGLTCRSFTGSPPPEGKQQLAPVPSNISCVGGWESSPQAAPPHHSLLPLFSFPPLFPFRLCPPEELLPHPTRPDRPSPAPVKPSAQHRGTSIASRPLRQPHGSATLRERVSCPPSLPASK